MTRCFFCCLAAAAFLTAPFCTAAQEPLKIGVIQSLTGFAAEDGRNVVRALQLAEKDLKAAGRNVKILVEDDKSMPREAVTAYQRLTAGGVDAVVAGPYSFTTEAVIPLAGKDGMALLNTSALFESFDTTGGKGCFFNNAITIAEDAKPFERFLAVHKINSAVLLHVPSTWGKIQNEAYTRILGEHGIKIQASIETPAQDNNDWDTLVAKIASEKPDLLLLLLNKNDIAVILRKAGEQRFKPAIFGSKNTYDSWRLAQDPSAFNGVCFTYPLQQLYRAQNFIEAFRKEFKEEPRIFADTSYDSLGILVQAAVAARSSHESVPEVLRRMRFSGIAGEYSYAPERSLAISKSSLVCVQGGSIAEK